MKRTSDVSPQTSDQTKAAGDAGTERFLWLIPRSLRPWRRESPKSEV